MAIAGVAIVLAGAWALFQWPQSADSSTGSETSEAAASDDPGRLADAQGGTYDPWAIDQGPSGTGAESGTIAGGEGPSVEEEGSPRFDSLEAMEAEPGLPVIGELTGLGLVIGGLSPGQELEIVDLDTGEQLSIPDVDGSTERVRPVGVIDGQLVLERRSTVEVLDLARPEAGTQVIASTSVGEAGSARIDRGQIQVTEGSGSFADQEQAIFTVANYLPDGSRVGQFSADRRVFGFLWPATQDLMYQLGGGVYQRIDGEFDRVSAGELRAVGNSLVLVDECDDRLNCVSRWYDRDSWEQVALPPPMGIAGTSAEERLAADDRWLVSTNLFTRETTVVEVISGELVYRETPTAGDRSGVQFRFSQDGQWLLDPSTSPAQIIDLERGQAWVTGLSVMPEDAAVFVTLAGASLGSE